LRYGRAVELEPMRAPERKVVHIYLRDRTDIETHSEGDEPERRLVVSPLRPTAKP
jgi:spoIIIJ-associated protein